MITILKYFTFAAANGGTFISEWIRVPEGNQNWQLVFQIHSRVTATDASGQLQTTWDTATPHDVGSSANLATLGLSPQEISSGMGPMVRVVLTSADDATAVTLSLS